MSVGLYLISEFHKAFLEPIHKLLPGSVLTNDISEIIKQQPKVLVVSDTPAGWLKTVLPNTLFVSTRHGFVSKNYARHHFNSVDFVCLSSQWVKENCKYTPRLGSWVTGFVAMDDVFKNPIVNKGTKTILYAPTYNVNLRSIEMLEKWKPDVNVIIKPHPHTDENGMKILMNLLNKNTILIDPNRNIYDFFPFVDLLLSDVSSVMFYFLAMDKPIIAINNPNRFQDPHYDPTGVEWTWRDVAEQVDDVNELNSVINYCLKKPNEKKIQRAFYHERMFGNMTQGNAAELIADKIKTLLLAQTDWAEMAWNIKSRLQRIAGEL